MTIILSAATSPHLTLQVSPAALPQAEGGVTLRFGLYDGPLAFTLTADEARALLEQIERELAAGEDSGTGS